MNNKRVFAGVLAAAIVTGCTIRKEENAEGKKELEIEPAKVQITTDTKTVKVPAVRVVPDTTREKPEPEDTMKVKKPTTSQ